jgi:hypothetical protein
VDDDNVMTESLEGKEFKIVAVASVTKRGLVFP